MRILVSPLVWYLLVVIIGLLWLRRSTDGGDRRITNGLILLTLLIAFAATPLVEILLERSLRVDRAVVSGSTPEFIFVLGGGYARGATPSEDVLVTATAERLSHAVSEWRSNKSARLVNSGFVRAPERYMDLWVRVAASHGVPDSVLVFEMRSRHTNEHAIEALQLPGVTPTTHVAVVTSGIHMRRARGEFCRYFERLDVYPVAPTGGVVTLRGLVPQARTLVGSTEMLREWVGIVWYAIRGIGVEAVGEC